MLQTYIKYVKIEKFVCDIRFQSVNKKIILGGSKHYGKDNDRGGNQNF